MDMPPVTKNHCKQIWLDILDPESLTTAKKSPVIFSKRNQQQYGSRPQLCFTNAMDNSSNSAPSQNTRWTTVKITAIILTVMATIFFACSIFYLVKTSSIMSPFAKEQHKPATNNSTHVDIEGAVPPLSRQSTANSSLSGDQTQGDHPRWIETDAASTDDLFVVGSPSWSETHDDVDDDANWADNIHSNGSDIELRTLTPVIPGVVVSPKQVKTITVTLRDSSSSQVCSPGQQSERGKCGKSKGPRPDIERRQVEQTADLSSATKSGHISRLFEGHPSRPETPISHTFTYTGDGEYLGTGRADRRVGEPMVAKPVVTSPVSTVVIVSPGALAEGGTNLSEQ